MCYVLYAKSVWFGPFVRFGLSHASINNQETFRNESRGNCCLIYNVLLNCFIFGIKFTIFIQILWLHFHNLKFVLTFMNHYIKFERPYFSYSYTHILSCGSFCSVVWQVAETDKYMGLTEIAKLYMWVDCCVF